MEKLEVGQYWHNLKHGKELLIISKQEYGDCYVFRCTKYDIDPHEKGSIWPLDYDNIIEFGYVLGRHPDNIERVVRVGDVYEWIGGQGFDGMKWQQLDNKQMCIEGVGDYKTGRIDGSYWDFKKVNSWKFLYNNIELTPTQPEQWRPKEGDLVWNKVYENKAKLVSGQKGHIYYIFFDERGIERISQNFEIHKNQFEPYTGQDKKIDFSKAGQWLRNAEDGLICTFGELGRESEILFLALPFGAEYRRESTRLYSANVDWQLLTREQINPILEAIDKALK